MATATGVWLAQGEACEVLGMSPGALRRYANRGIVRTMSEPGKERSRRYNRGDLEAIARQLKVVRGLAVGDLVEWNYTHSRKQQGSVLEITEDRAWAWVRYGWDGYTTMIETIRLSWVRRPR